MKIDPYLFAELMYYLKDMAKRGDDTAKQFLDDLPQHHDHTNKRSQTND